MSKPNLRKQQNKSKLQVIFDQGTKFVSRSFIALYLPSTSFSRTIIASKKIGNAVKRNRSKRRLRELTRLYIEPNIPPVRLILLSRVKTASVDFSNLLQECNNFTNSINTNISRYTY